MTQNTTSKTMAAQTTTESLATILVVEDDANLLAGIKDILQLEHYTIETAMDGVEALRKLDEMPAPPDLIVSDIMMPHMDGFEFLKQVRKNEALISVPFIYLTAKGEKADVQHGKRLGVDDYVVKPFNADDLILAIKARLDRHREMREAQERREEELKRSILTILNHEFRTPLTFVVAYSDMLSDFAQIPSEDTETGEMLMFLEGVRNGADRLRRLIENFIMLVELETGSAKKTYLWKRRAIQPGEWQFLIEQAVEAALKVDPNHQPTPHITVAEGLPAIEGHDEFLQNIIYQLATNACKFSDEAEHFEVRVGAEGDEVCLTVQDFGRGIPEKRLKEIWESFYQIDREYFEDQGTGSGLPIVRGLVNMHNGKVNVETEEGAGTIFTVRFPMMKSIENPAE